MKKAFTLIELLVVIAIIAILAAILFPVLAQAKAAAKKAASLANVKSISLGVIMYAGDYDDTIVLGQYKDQGDVMGSNWRQWNWNELVMPYIKNGNLGKATNSGTAAPLAGGIFTAPGDPVNCLNGSYAPNRFLFPDGCFDWNSWCNNGNNVPTVYSLANIENTGDKVFLIQRGIVGTNNWLTFIPDEYLWVDSVGSDGSQAPTQFLSITPLTSSAGGDCDRAKQDWAWGPFCGQLPRYRYNKATPAGYLDGHAKTHTRTARTTGLDWYKNIFVPEAMSPAY